MYINLSVHNLLNNDKLSILRGEVKMKVGILSFHDSRNYGAVLQIYALKRTLEKLNVEVKVIDYSAIDSEYEFSLSRELKNKSLPLALAKFLYHYIFVKKDMDLKRGKFLRFANKNLNLTKKYNSLEEFVMDNNFDSIICGSDQIWNPQITNGFDRMMFLDFNDKRIKKFSYAASVGDLSTIDVDEKKEEFIRLIKNFDGISVREKELADFISKNSNINPVVTLDPTLLMDAEEYGDIEEKANQQGKYVLVYQLARYPKSMEVAEIIAKEKGLKILEIINNPYRLKRNRSMLFTTSPSEFISLIKNAEYIITNSFHGTAFSIIFKKNFYTIASRTRNSRITNILTALELGNRLLTERSEDFSRDNIDYLKVDRLLKEGREVSLNYLKNIVERGTNG